MKNSDLMVKLERIITDLVKVDGVDGGLIVDGTGKIIAQHILQDIDVELFGPMANVITSSSKRLLSSSNQGEIHRVLVESLNGKALFLNLENVHLIVLMKDHANVGLILVSSKRSAEQIGILTRNLKPEIDETKKEPVIAEIKPEITSDEELVDSQALVIDNKTSPDHIEIPIKDEPVMVDEQVSTEINPLELNSESQEISMEEHVETTKTAELDTNIELSPEDGDVAPDEVETLKEEDEIESKESIPIIKPPIAFPDIKKITDVPDDVEARADLILDIYEAIFRAMSIGASKIMGVAPARGLTQKFLPSQECKKLLDGVGVESNSTINFLKIRENASKIELEDRESQFIEDFTKILDVITDNYGKVMGYEAFRGMVRPEFKKIAYSYGPVMNRLGITDKMHPEISELFG